MGSGLRVKDRNRGLEEVVVERMGKGNEQLPGSRYGPGTPCVRPSHQSAGAVRFPLLSRKKRGSWGKGQWWSLGWHRLPASLCVNPGLLHQNMRSAVQGSTTEGGVPAGFPRLDLIWKRALSLASALPGPLWLPEGGLSQG